MVSVDDYKKSVELISRSDSIVAFTGAGISVESGIPTFRGPDGIWSHYDPKILDIGYFVANPEECWRDIRGIFYDYMGDSARPNAAHRLLSEIEHAGKLAGIITQNIDNLHQESGSKNVVEFHGTAQTLSCMECNERSPFMEHDLQSLPPYCLKCGGLLKPDFVFFGEPIPPEAYSRSLELVNNADLLIIIGTTGEIMPASMIPYEAKKAKVIEINIEPSSYTNSLTDIFLQDRATVVAKQIAQRMNLEI